jgi:hypothetical protein
MNYYKLKGSVTNQNKESLRQDKNCIIRVMPNNEFQCFIIEGTEFEMDIKENYYFLNENQIYYTTDNEEDVLKQCIKLLKYTPYVEIDKIQIIKYN